MEVRTASIAVIAVILRTVLVRSVAIMSNAYRTALESYLVSMLQAKRMLEIGIITPED